VKDAIYVLGGVALVAFLVVRQRRSGRFRERSLLFPIALGAYGVVLLTRTSEHEALTTTSAAILILSAVASVLFGVVRGRTIELFVRGGELWERASWTTIGVGWGGLVVTRLMLIAVAAAIGAKVASSPTSIPLMLAITLAAQMLVVRGRARASGLSRRAAVGSGYRVRSEALWARFFAWYSRSASGESTSPRQAWSGASSLAASSPNR
jgi:hypothetical protein